MESFRRSYGHDILDSLPEVVWQLPDNAVSVTRYRYHDHVAELFASAFADTLGKWCKQNGLYLTGHMMDEDSLQSQTMSLGEAMRSYRSFTIPGIDILCDKREYTTAKQAQSAARQYGCPGVMSELYGVTGWHHSFMGHKRQGDWQAAMGVTVRVHHLAWVSMAGEAKRDYPAAIGHQSPWYSEYKYIEDHFARINTVMTRGVPVVSIGVIHPIESAWLSFGPYQQTKPDREQQEWQFHSLIEWLSFGSCDFDFIAESLLPSQWQQTSEPVLKVGQMQYKVILVPGLRTIRSTTFDALEQFANAGGTVVFVGRIPDHVDAIPSTRALGLADRCARIAFEKAAVLGELADWRNLRITAGPGADWKHQPVAQDSILYQMRKDGESLNLFLCNTDSKCGRCNSRIELDGEWAVTLLDSFTGEMGPVAAEYRDGVTTVIWDAPAAGSLLLQLTPGRCTTGQDLSSKTFIEIGRLTCSEVGAPVELSEPNVLLLDQPEWRLNGGEWQPKEEILRIANKVHTALGVQLRQGGMAQPWTDVSPAPQIGVLELRFRFHSDVAVIGAMLALEDAQESTLYLNDIAVQCLPSGTWVDQAIQTVPLPDMVAGPQELRLVMPMNRKRNIEACYLLGDFGVKVSGRNASLTAPVRTLTFGDWSTQGLPFYGGNVTHRFDLPACAHTRLLDVFNFSAPVVTVASAGKRLATIATQPFHAVVPANTTSLELTVYGNRANTFGPLHNCDHLLTWQGPEAWRSTGQAWSYEYQLKPMGLLSEPRWLTRQLQGA